MRPFSFAQRLLLAFLAMTAVAVGASLLLTWWWIGTLLAVLVLFAAAWSLCFGLISFVRQQHEHFLAVLRDLRGNLQSGRLGLRLKSERPPDSFGRLAREINLLAEETEQQISRQLEHSRDLEQNKALFQSILGTMIEGVLVLDSQQRVLYVNNAARRMLDCSARNVEGRPVWEVVRAADLQEAIDVLLDSGSDFRKEVEFKRSKSAIEVSAAPLPIKPEPGVVLVLHDVTELRRLERMRREFVSNVSHELKTPLTSIQAYADTLLNGALEDPENSRLFLSRILEQSDRLQLLIQDILRLARIESQSEAFQMKPVLLAKTLEECVEARQAVARSRQIALALVPGDREIRVLADAEGLQTIFDNLINNGLNYSHEGGRIEVRWRVADGQVVIEVQDNGIGIPAEHQVRIFERFYRVDRARGRGMGGTGLGLAIVKHLALVFGGDVEVESAVGAGSTFRVRLPVYQEPAASLQSADTEPANEL